MSVETTVTITVPRLHWIMLSTAYLYLELFHTLRLYKNFMPQTTLIWEGNEALLLPTVVIDTEVIYFDFRADSHPTDNFNIRFSFHQVGQLGNT